MQWTAMEAARFLRVSEDTLHEWVAQRGLPASTFNGRLLFNRIKLVDWALENGVPFAAGASAHFPSMRKSVAEGGIHRDVPGNDLGAVLRSVVELLPLPPDTDAEMLWEMLMAREQEGATALGHGIAVPHARHPIILGVEHAFLSLCFLRQGLDLGAPDGEPITTLFVMVTPNIQTHLHYLGQLGHVLRHENLIHALQTRADDAEIFRCLEAAEESETPASGGV